MKYLMTTAFLFSAFTFTVQAKGICVKDKVIFECNIHSGKLQQATLCEPSSGKIYLSELTNKGSVNNVKLTDAQVKRWESQGILQWECGPKEKKLGICSTITGNQEYAEYLIEGMGSVNNGSCN